MHMFLSKQMNPLGVTHLNNQQQQKDGKEKKEKWRGETDFYKNKFACKKRVSRTKHRYLFTTKTEKENMKEKLMDKMDWGIFRQRYNIMCGISQPENIRWYHICIITANKKKYSRVS